MKQKITFLLCFSFILQVSFAGEIYNALESLAGAEKYLEDNILDLDPIEGVYNTNLLVVVNDPFVGERRLEQNYTLLIFNSKKALNDPMGSYLMCIVKNGIPELYAYINKYGNSQYSFKEYNVQGNLQQVTFAQRDLYNFSYTRSERIDYASSVRKTTAHKIYPTQNMYYAATDRPKVVEPTEWSGTGFALNSGYIVTNNHVIMGALSIKVYQTKENGVRESFTAKVVVTDKENDIAILKIVDNAFQGFGALPYKLKSGVCEVGESVWTIGYPMTNIMGDEIKFTDGVISARSGVDGKTAVYQISVPIQPGNSGGPLFDNNGCLVGITSSGLNRDLQTENVNYAIKISYLRLLIEDNLPTTIIPQGTAMQNQSAISQIKLAKNYTFYIECKK